VHPWMMVQMEQPRPRVAGIRLYISAETNAGNRVRRKNTAHSIPVAESTNG
jgi:hypothetical protein